MLCDGFRGTAISSILSKMFEVPSCILVKSDCFLSTNNWFSGYQNAIAKVRHRKGPDQRNVSPHPNRDLSLPIISFLRWLTIAMATCNRFSESEMGAEGNGGRSVTVEGVYCA